MKKDYHEQDLDRRHPQRRGRGKRSHSKGLERFPEGTEEPMTRKKQQPDFTRAETYMQEQAPAIADRTRSEVDAERRRDQVQAHQRIQRRRALRIAGVFLVAGIALVCLSDLYGRVVDAIAGVAAAFAIAATIHTLQPRPLLRFGLVVIALACLAVTFATVLNLHLHGMD